MLANSKSHDVWYGRTDGNSCCLGDGILHEGVNTLLCMKGFHT